MLNCHNQPDPMSAVEDAQGVAHHMYIYMLGRLGEQNNYYQNCLIAAELTKAASYILGSSYLSSSHQDRNEIMCSISESLNELLDAMKEREKQELIDVLDRIYGGEVEND